MMNGVLEDEARLMADTRWREGGWGAPTSRRGAGGKRRQAGADTAKRVAGSRHSARLERAEKTRRWCRVVIDSEDEHMTVMVPSRRRRIRIDQMRTVGSGDTREGGTKAASDAYAFGERTTGDGQRPEG